MKLFLIFLFIPITFNAQTLYSDLLNNFMTAYASVNKFSGTVIVVKKDEVVYEKSFDKADIEWNVNNTNETKYKIASVTKQFTAACILLLEEQGKLKLENKLSSYIPDYPKGDSITIHMLLNHTSGIKNLTEIPDYFNYEKSSLTPDSLISLFKHQPFDFLPGTGFRYSNSGYILLGYIIEKVSAESYANYLDHLFKKLELENTAYDDWNKLTPFRAKGYTKTAAGYENASYVSMSLPYSAGAIHSTVGDLYKWNKLLMNNQVISANSLKKMTTAYLGDYGYGLIISNFQNQLRYTHGGSMIGFGAATSFFPKETIFVAVLSNNESNAFGIAESLSSIMLDVSIEVPYIHKEITVDAKILDNYIGTYEGAFAFQIIKKDNKLYRYRADRGYVELKPESPTKLFYGDNSDKQVEFQVDKYNKVMKVFFINAGAKTEITKIK